MLACGLAATGCSSRTEKVVLLAVQEGRYAQAQSALDKEYGGGFTPEGQPNEDVQEGRKQALLWCLESAQVQRAAGELQRTEAVLATASAKLAYIGSYVGNDTLLEYEGSGYEHIQVDWMRSLNQMQIGEIALGAWMPQGASAAAIGASANPKLAFDNAISFARRMTLKELTEVKDASGSKRYGDDPLARLYAGALMDASLDRAADDRQFADAMLKGAVEAYRQQHAQFAKQSSFRYEVGALPDIAHRLLVRNGVAYDPAGFAAWADQHGIDASSALLRSSTMGSILVLNEVDFISPREPLAINAVVATIPLGSYNGNDGQRYQAQMGGLIFWATGPGADTLKGWGALPLPAGLTNAMSVQGAPQWWKFEIPIHGNDAPIAPLQRIQVRPLDPQGMSAQVMPEVVSDLDAFARATLKDEQAFTAVKTVTRVAVKQVAAFLTAQAVQKQTDNALLAFATQAIGSVAMSATENADLRSSNLLPDHVEAALIDVPPGTYQVTVGTNSAGTVTVKADRTTIVSIRSFPTPVIVKK